jgi:hypothetical protein
VRRVHHDGANDAHAVGAIPVTTCFTEHLPSGTDAAMRSPFAIDSRNQELSRAMNTNKTIGIGL